MSTVTFQDRVAIITGAGNGLGRTHALALAKYGVKVVVCDLKGAESVAEEIVSMGGEAIASKTSVTDVAGVESMVAKTIETFGQVDILVNNAGILRDKSFAKMSVEDFRLVVDVHLNGSAICSKAVWSHMREREYGRICMTTSSSGMYGNFGQANYGAAKAGLVGLMNTLVIEGAKYDIRVNTLSPFARTAMTEDLLPEPVKEIATADVVSAGLVYLVSDDAPNRTILTAGARGFAATKIYETRGISVSGEDCTPETVAERWSDIVNPDGQEEYTNGGQQGQKFAIAAMQQAG